MRSIVISIVTWNSETYLKKCLDACLQQQYRNKTIIVVDNCSTDKTRDILNEYKGKITCILNHFNNGFSGGHNQSIRSVKGDYYCVLNPDVFLHDNYISECISFLESEPKYGGCIGKVFQCGYKDGKFIPKDIIDTCGLSIKRSYQFVAIDNGMQDNQHENKDIFGVDGMCPVYSGRMLEDVCLNYEYFDEYFFAYCEDQDLSWRAVNKGWKFAFVHKALANHVRTWKPATLKSRKEINKDIRRMALRNHYLMLVRNLSVSDFFKFFPFIVFRMLKIFVYCIFFERYTLKAFWEVIGKFRKYYKMRHY